MNELKIVEVFSRVNLPEELVRNSNIHELLQGMQDEQTAVLSDTQRLQRLRQEKKDGNWFGNLLNGRASQVDEAQLDLSQSIGRLTQSSAQLLVVNTAISRVLHEQQGVLQFQQGILKEQTERLEQQNFKILHQQAQLEEQQEAISQANQGLLEAKGVTQSQAIELIGCVERVKGAEAKVEEANQNLRQLIDIRLQQTIEHCVNHVSQSFTAQDQRNSTFQQQLNRDVAHQYEQTQNDLERFAAGNAEFEESISHALAEQATTSQHAHAQADERFKLSVQQLSTRLNERLTIQDQDQSSFQQQLIDTSAQQHKQTQIEVERIAQDNAEFNATTTLTVQTHATTTLKQIESLKNNLQTSQQLLSDTLQAHAQAQEIKVQEQGATLTQSLAQLTAELTATVNQLTATKEQLEGLTHKQSTTTRKQVYALTGVGCMSAGILAWEVAQYFSWV